MKKLYFLLIALSFLSTTKAQIVTIPNANFKAKLLAASATNQTAKNFSDVYFKVDANSDGQIQISEALLVKQLNIGSTGISSLVGIASFTNIQILNCQSNPFTSLDVSSLINLQSLNCDQSSNLSSLNVSGLTNLQTLECTNSKLQSLDASGLTNLKALYCGFNQLTTMNVSGLTNLQDLICEGNQLSSLDLTGLINLVTIRSQVNSLTSINLNGLANLEVIDVLQNNLFILDLTGLSKLKYLECDFNQLTSLDLSGLNNLLGLNISGNKISNIDVSQLTKLEYLYCYYTDLTSVDLTGLNSLLNLDISGNKISDIDVSQLKKLEFLNCYDMQLTSLDLRGLNSLRLLNCENNLSLSCITVTDPAAAAANNWLKDATASYSTNCISLYTAIPDTNFENALFTLGIDTVDGDHQVLTSAISGVSSLDVSSKSIANLTGIAAFTNLQSLNCTGNQLTSINVTGLTNLQQFYCSANSLTSLDVRGLTTLSNFECTGNPSLTCILVDDIAAATTASTTIDPSQSPNTFWAKDATANYSYCDCSLTTTWNGTVWSNGSPTTGNYAAIIAGNYNEPANINACTLTVNNMLSLRFRLVIKLL